MIAGCETVEINLFGGIEISERFRSHHCNCYFWIILSTLHSVIVVEGYVGIARLFQCYRRIYRRFFGRAIKLSFILGRLIITSSGVGVGVTVTTGATPPGPTGRGRTSRSRPPGTPVLQGSSRCPPRDRGHDHPLRCWTVVDEAPPTDHAPSLSPVNVSVPSTSPLPVST